MISKLKSTTWKQRLIIALLVGVGYYFGISPTISEPIAEKVVTSQDSQANSDQGSPDQAETSNSNDTVDNLINGASAVLNLIK